VPDPFFDDLLKAYLTVITHPTQKVSVERGDKKALVMMNHEDGGAVYIRIAPVAQERAESRIRFSLKQPKETTGGEDNA